MNAPIESMGLVYHIYHKHQPFMWVNIPLDPMNVLQDLLQIEASRLVFSVTYFLIHPQKLT